MEVFLQHLKDIKPTFHCYEAGKVHEEINFSIQVKNRINIGANPGQLAVLEDMIPNNSSQFKSLYLKMNGVKLYCQNKQPKIELFPIDRWKDENVIWKSSFEDFNTEELYDFQIHGLAFGEVSQSGNYFIYYNGKIYYSDHDDWEEIILGNSLFEFLDKISNNPAKLLYEFGCYSRYGDGKTKAQWIPKSYTKE